MCACTTLSGEVAAALVTDACSHVSPANARETLLFFAHALASQPALRQPPPRAAAALLRMPELADEVASARSAGLRVDGAAVELICAAPVLLNPPQTADGPPVIPSADVHTVHETTVQLVRGLQLQKGTIRAPELCRQAAAALVQAQGEPAVALASAVLQALKALPECSIALEVAVQQAGEGASTAVKKQLHAAMVGGGGPQVPSLPMGAQLTDVLQAGSSNPEYAEVVAGLRRLKETGGLDARMHARVADAALGALRASSAKTAAGAAASPLLELLPLEETVPELLQCLQRATRRLVKPLGDAAMREVGGVVPGGVGGMLWQMEHAALVAVHCLEALCAFIGGNVEWERAVVALALPWFLVAQEWPGAGLAHVAEKLAQLGAWQSVFGDGVASALRAAASPEAGQPEAAAKADRSGLATADGSAADVGKGKKRRSSKGRVSKEDGSGDAPPPAGAEERPVGRKGAAGRPAGSTDAWVREQWASRGVSDAGQAATVVQVVCTLQGAFVASAAARDAGGAVQAWERLADIAAATGVVGRHVAAAVAAAQACCANVADSEVTSSCALWLLMQMSDEHAVRAMDAACAGRPKAQRVADQSGALVVRPGRQRVFGGAPVRL